MKVNFPNSDVHLVSKRNYIESIRIKYRGSKIKFKKLSMFPTLCTLPPYFHMVVIQYGSNSSNIFSHFLCVGKRKK